MKNTCGIVALLLLTSIGEFCQERHLKAFAIVVLVSWLSIIPASAFAMKSAAPAKLMCFNKTTEELRRSNVLLGCEKTESSLGATVVAFPAQRPKALNPYLKTRFLASQALAKREKISLYITSGYRTYERQAFLFRQAVKKYGSAAAASRWVLPPELSHHTWGMAIDVNYPNAPLSTKWLARNGYKFGLCRAYENEWWHFEPLTVPGVRCPARLLNASGVQAQ